MKEPMLMRCSRCDGLVAAQDSTRCGYHETDPLCSYCWKHHLRTHERAAGVLRGVLNCRPEALIASRDGWRWQ